MKPGPGLMLMRDEIGDWLSISANDHALVAFLHPREQAGEDRLGFVHVYGFHFARD